MWFLIFDILRDILAIFGLLAAVFFCVAFYALNELGKIVLPVAQGVSEAIGRKYT